MNDYALGVPQALGASSSPTFAGLTVTGAATFASTVTATGQFLAGNGTAAAPPYSFSGDPDSGFYPHAANIIGMSLGGSAILAFAATQLLPFSSGTMEVGSSSGRFARVYLGGNTPAASAPMLDLAQTWNDGAVAFIGIDVTITDTASLTSYALPLRIRGGSAGTTTLFQVDTAGKALAPYFQATGAGYFFGNGSRIDEASDGVFALHDAAYTSFGRLCFGGTTSAFPAWKRSGAELHARLADDSATCDVVVHSLNAAAEIQVAGAKVVASRGAAVADATGAGDIVAQFNTLLARLRVTGGHGLIAD